MLRASRNREVDWSSYRPVTAVQWAFHKSKAKHKLLIGGYRGGKTYPAIHEALFICFDNPGHEFAIFRNTWDSLTENVEKDFIEVARRYNAFNEKDWNSRDHNLKLRCGTTVKFRPLSLSRKQLKGLSVCGFFIDDPDVDKYQETISFLFTRLTNAAGRPNANYFSSIICANYEGHDWLWKTYIRGREEGGDGLFAYWWVKTLDNPTLPEDYIEIQETLHSKAWMDRYIYMNPDSYVGLVYDEYDKKVHNADLSWCFKDTNLTKIRVIDLGITHPSVVLDMATDGKNIFVYNEWYKTNVRVSDVADYLLENRHKENFSRILIDPSAAKREQITGISPKELLRRQYGIRVVPANNSEKYGIEIVKGLLTIRGGKSRVLIDPYRCPNLDRELETLRWDKPEMADFDELGYKEKVRDINNDATDCFRYGCVYYNDKVANLYSGNVCDLKKKHQLLWKERYEKLSIYKKNFKNNYPKFLEKIHNKGLTKKSI